MSASAGVYLDYLALPIVGFLSDGKQTGFKTPVVQNGREPAVQDADRNGIVMGFIACSEEDIERIYRINYPIAIRSEVGKEVVFIFRTVDDTFCERRSKLIPRLLVETRRQESMTRSDAINVMIFARLPLNRIYEAIDHFAASLAGDGINIADQWAHSFKRRVAGKVSHDSYLAEEEWLGPFSGGRVSLASLESEVSDEIDRIEDENERQKSALTLDNYYKLKSALQSKNADTRDSGRRELYMLSAVSDVGVYRKIAFLVNFLFVKSCWDAFVRRNSECYGRKIKIQTPSREIAEIARLDASQRISAIAELFSIFRPFSHRDQRGKELPLPPGLVLRGRIVSVSPAGNLLVQAGSKFIDIDANLVSIVAHNKGPRAGDHVVFCLRKNNLGSFRGSEFIGSLIEIFFPMKSDIEKPSEIVLGASNSWAVVRTSKGKYGKIIAGTGVYVAQLSELCGLRRLTVIRKSDETDSEVVEFCRATWRDLTIKREENRYILSLEVPADANSVDDRKLRTFKSMWGKLFPNIEMEVRLTRSDKNYTI